MFVLRGGESLAFVLNLCVLVILVLALRGASPWPLCKFAHSSHSSSDDLDITWLVRYFM